MSMVGTTRENSALKKNIVDVLDVEKNQKKAFVLWFSLEVLAIPDHRWPDFKCWAILLLEWDEDDMPPPQMIPPQQPGHPQQLGQPQQQGGYQQQGRYQQQGVPQQQGPLHHQGP